MRPVVIAVVVIAVIVILRGLVVLARHLNAVEEAKDAAAKATPPPAERAGRIAAAARAAEAVNPLDRPLTTSCGHSWTLRHTACPVCFDAIRSENKDLRCKVAALRDALTEQVNKCWSRSGVGLADHEAECDDCRTARRAMEEKL